MRIFLAGLVGASLAFATGAESQDVTGTYHAISRSGVAVTLTLRQDHLGEVTGTLSTSTVTYDVHGTITEGKVFGTMKAGTDARFFEAVLHQSVLSTTLYEPGATGGPDYLTGQNILFQRQEDGLGGQASSTGALARDQALRQTFETPRQLVGKAYLSRRILLEALFQSTGLSERGPAAGTVSSGTLTVQGTDSGYEAQPTDRLVVHIEGQTHEFIIEEMRGNFLAHDAAEWLTSTHALRYRYRVPGQAELSVVLSFDRVLFEMSISGWYVDSGTRFDTDLVAKGQASGTLDQYGQQVWANFTATGSLRGGGLEIDVRQQHNGSLGVSSGVLHPDASRASPAGRSRVAISNSVRMGQEVYGFSEVEIETEIRLAPGTAEAVLVSLTGSVFRGGQLFGTMVLQGGQPLVQAGSTTISLAKP